MRRPDRIATVLASLGFLLLPAAGFAGEGEAPPAKAAEDGGRAATKAFETLLAEHDGAEGGYKEKYAAFKPRFEAFAKEHAGSEAGLRAELWLLQNTWWLRDDKGTMQAEAAARADRILAAYADSPLLAKVPEFHYDFAPADRDRIFGELLKSGHPEVRASATLRLALASKGERRTELLETLAKEYGEVPFRFGTFGEVADAHLHPHPAAALEVGQPAPEIAGKTHDGKTLRLSDFKGRVVVLDFWGDW